MATRSFQSAEDQANRLFQQKTVAEIKSIEKQTRNDIERKKEELRQMVGERYRELIDAADTIVDMKNSANKVMSDIGHMQQHCKTLHKLHQSNSVVALTTDQDRSMMAGRLSFFSLVSQIKLLVNMPETLWNVLEALDHLCAARLCIMARHIMDSVNEMTASGELRNAVKSFPILPRQWAAIGHFPAVILQACRTALQDPYLHLKKVEESLTAILLLEKCSLSDVFQELLHARKAAVESLFSSEQQGHSFKSLACRLIWLVRTTLQQVFAIFGTASKATPSHADSRLLQLANESVSSTDLQLGHWSRFLPASLQDFNPTTSMPSLSSASSQNVDIQPQCEEFLASCVSLVPSSLSRALTFIDSLESLVSIRDSVYDLLLKDDSLPADSPAVSGDIIPCDLPAWDGLCSAVVGRSVVLYDDLLSDSLRARMEELICSQLSLSCSTVHKSVVSLLDTIPSSSTTTSSAASATGTPAFPVTVGAPSSGGDASSSTTWLDRNVSAYIWQDSADDVMSLSPSLLRQSNHDSSKTVTTSQSSSGVFTALGMKARGITPGAARVCSQFDADMTSLLTGVRMVVGVTEKPDATPVRRKTFFTDEKVEPVPFNKFADASKLRSYLRLTSFDVLSRLVEKLGEELARLRREAEDSSTSRSDRARGVDCCLLLARLASSLSECCPALEACLLGLESEASRDSASRTYSRRSASRGGGLATKNDEQSAERQQLLTIRSSINDLVVNAYSVWISSTVKSLSSALSTAILATNPRTTLAHAMAWEEIKIEEEGEEGRKVESMIRLPMQVSSSISSSLFLLCEEISRVGGHTLPRPVQHSLIKQFGDRLLEIVEQAVGGRSQSPASGTMFEKKLPQPRALQLLFDLKCAATLLAGRGEKAAELAAYNSRVRSLVSWLESCVDPFDLDVFEPYLASNLSRYVQRCSSLYGFLYSLAKQSSTNFVGGASALAVAATSSMATGKSAQQEQHNVLPMAAAINRLPLLPVGTGMTTPQVASKGNADRLLTPKISSGGQMAELSERMQFFSLPVSN